MTRARRLLFGSGSNFAHYALGKAVVFRDQSKRQHSLLNRRLLRQSMRDQALAYAREVRWLRYAK